MRIALLLGTAVSVMSTAALAADIDYGPPVEEPDWAGLYIGAHAGYGSGDREAVLASVPRHAIPISTMTRTAGWRAHSSGIISWSLPISCWALKLMRR